jgi:hypothetical protein
VADGIGTTDCFSNCRAMLLNFLRRSSGAGPSGCPWAAAGGTLVSCPGVVAATELEAFGVADREGAEGVSAGGLASGVAAKTVAVGGATVVAARAPVEGSGVIIGLSIARGVKAGREVTSGFSA